LKIAAWLMAVFWLFSSTVIVTAQEEPVGAAYRGERIFAENCTECHGNAGRGDGPMAAEVPVPIPNFTDPTFVEARSPQALYDVIAEGRMENLMPPWKEALSEQEIWDAAAFVWSLHLDAAALARGAAAYEQGCAECHGSEGTGAGETPPPDLAGKQWLANSQSEYLEAVTAATHPPVEGLSDAEIELAAEIARDFSLGFGLAATNVGGEGTIDVLVENATTGEKPGGLPVRLYMFEGDSFVSSRAAETDADGRARFEALPSDASWVYIAEVQYNDLPFSSDIQQFEDPTAAVEIALPVYDGGGVAEDIRVERAHWVLNLSSPQRLDVGEIYILSNTGDRVYDGEEGDDGVRRVLALAVPENANNVGVEGAELGERFLVEGNAVIDTMPMAPGQRQILIRYSLPIEDGRVELSHPIAYAVDHLNLLVPDLGMTVEAPGWDEGEAMPSQEGSYRNFARTNLEPGEESGATLSDIQADMLIPPGDHPAVGREIVDSQATPGISGQPYFPYLVILVGIIVLALGTVYALRRQKHADEQAPQLREQQRQILIQDLADLDDDYESGELSRSDYESERRMLKAQLIALMREEKQA
jgi:mono/diheme cytochrome c family protein